MVVNINCIGCEFFEILDKDEMVKCKFDGCFIAPEETFCHKSKNLACYGCDHFGTNDEVCNICVQEGTFIPAKAILESDVTFKELNKHNLKKEKKNETDLDTNY